MTRPEITELVFGTCDQFVAGMDAHQVDDAHRLELFLRAIETAAPELRKLMERVADGPDDPNPQQVEAIQWLGARAVKVAAAACGLLLTLPIDKASLGPMAVIAGERH